MYAQNAIKHLAGKIMQNVITNLYMMKWPLFSIKTQDGDQILQKKPNSHYLHLPSFSSSKIATDTTKNNDTILSSGVPYAEKPKGLISESQIRK